MHLHTFKWINQLDAAIKNRFIACRLTLILLKWWIWWALNNAGKWQMGFNSAFKGLNTAQHVSGILMPIIRSLSTAVAASDLPLERCGSSAVGRGRSGPDRPRPTALLSPRSYGKPEAAAAAVDRLLMMGKRTPETCWAVNKRQTINWRNFCI